MAATKGKLSSFARASKDRLSGRRLIQPSEKKKKPNIHAFTSSKDTNSEPEDEQETFLHSDKNGKDVNCVGETSKKAIPGPENCCIYASAPLEPEKVLLSQNLRANMFLLETVHTV